MKLYRFICIVDSTLVLKIVTSMIEVSTELKFSIIECYTVMLPVVATLK